jgi:hypothetical protein
MVVGVEEFPLSPVVGVVVVGVVVLGVVVVGVVVVGVVVVGVVVVAVVVVVVVVVVVDVVGGALGRSPKSRMNAAKLAGLDVRLRRLDP